MNGLKLTSGQTILFIGDSITDCGRRAAAAPLGDGYVKLFAEILAVRNPDLAVTVINKGIGGNKIDDLKNRWHDDVMAQAFDWLSVKIGINDLHRQLSASPDSGYSPSQFFEDYDAVLSTTLGDRECGLVLIDPFYLSVDHTDLGVRGRALALLPEYVGKVDQLAEKYGAIHLRTQTMFERCLQFHPADNYCPEPVHPYRVGHLAIALELYRVLGGSL